MAATASRFVTINDVRSDADAAELVAEHAAAGMLEDLRVAVDALRPMHAVQARAQGSIRVYLAAALRAEHDAAHGANADGEHACSGYATACTCAVAEV